MRRGASFFWVLGDLVDAAGSDALLAHLQTAPTSQVSWRSEMGVVFDHLATRKEDVSLDLFLEGIAAVPAGFALAFTGDQDVPVMGLRGSPSNCSELTEPDCDRLCLQRRSESSLGVAACLRTPTPVVCLGRGGSYLQWIFGFGSLSPDAGAFLATASEAQLGDLCAASSVAQSIPRFACRAGPLEPACRYPPGRHGRRKPDRDEQGGCIASSGGKSSPFRYCKPVMRSSVWR
jgi:hypothetical protein